MITVTHREGSIFDVAVQDERGSSRHEVTVWPSDVERYAPGSTPEELIEASFEFLLAREPKEAILRRFELPAIERYFPEYPAEMRARA
jgi:hypothetical protein